MTSALSTLYLAHAILTGHPGPADIGKCMVTPKPGVQAYDLGLYSYFRSITSATWKRAAGIPAGKGMNGLARACAIERWPERA